MLGCQQHKQSAQEWCTGQSVYHHNVTRAHQYAMKKARETLCSSLCVSSETLQKAYGRTAGAAAVRLAVEHLLRVPDEALEVDRQLHARLAAAQHLVPQHLQVLLQLRAPTAPRVTAPALLPAANLHSRCAASLQRIVVVPCRSCRPKSQQQDVSSSQWLPPALLLTDLSFPLLHVCSTVPCYPLKT